MDDMKGYLESALGNISMFPIKCPMHYDSCTGHIDAKIAKRILNESQYIKFLEFSDRCIYGDGKISLLLYYMNSLVLIFCLI
jgi:hypothetical protein